MRTALKWIGIVVGGLLALIVIAAVVVYALGARRLTASHPQPSENFTIPTDAEVLARGEYLVGGVTGCIDCHGESLGGTEFINEAPIGLLWAANLTAGQGGVGGTYTDADWERAVRHGVRPNGEVLMIMPSHQFNQMSDADLGAVLAYVKTFPPVDQVVPERRIDPLGTMLIGAGLFGELPAEQVDHDAGHAATVEPAVSAEYGGYLTSLAACRDCHGPNLDGVVAAGPPLPVPPPNLTPSGDLGTWTEADFIQAIRTGVTPEGRTLSEEMPWPYYANMDDNDLGAIFAYLQSLSPSTP
jgi:mono/diheme cytochrome c family protein